MQCAHGRSEESRKNVCSPSGLTQSVLVDPNKPRVGIPETQAMCMSPESSDRTNVTSCNMAKASDGVVLPTKLISVSPNCCLSFAAFEAIKGVPRIKNLVCGKIFNHDLANAT